MEPTSRQPGAHHPTRPYSRWERLRRSWRSWAPFLPSAVYIIGLILHIRLNSVLGMVAFLAACTYYGIFLVPLTWSAVKANPSVLWLRVMRRVLAGGIVAIVATICLAITSAVSGQTNGAAQIVLVVFVFASFGFIFLALCIGLLDASKNVIERYRADRTGTGA